MDDDLRMTLAHRAHELWQAAGSPEGHELTYRFRAEQELENSSVAGEEDPFVAVEENASAP